MKSRQKLNKITFMILSYKLPIKNAIIFDSMPEGNRLSKFLFIVGVTAVLVLGANFIHNANAQKDSNNTNVANSNEKTSKKDLTELSKCESDLSKDDGQLTSADVRDCYGQVFQRSNNTGVQTSKRDLTELSKCESDLSKDDGQLTSADVRDCYGQVFQRSNNTGAR
jgi:hypothetical protein